MTDPAQLADLAINQPDVALIFEGGDLGRDAGPIELFEQGEFFQPGQRIVYGDVLLRLRGVEQRQAHVRRVGHETSFF